MTESHQYQPSRAAWHGTLSFPIKSPVPDPDTTFKAADSQNVPAVIVECSNGNVASGENSSESFMDFRNALNGLGMPVGGEIRQKRGNDHERRRFWRLKKRRCR